MYQVISMKIKICLVTVFFPLLALVSCGKIDTLPDVPRIEYTSFTVFDTTDLLGNIVKGGRLKFYFEDGDGNVGLPVPSEEEGSLDSINLFLTLYRMNNGSITQAPDNDPLKPTGYRIPYMERTGQNKILKGNISVVFMYLFCTEEDSIRYDFYIKDRAENLSNTVSTGVIPLFNNGIYAE
jgi:hypothetical protein